MSTCLQPYWKSQTVVPLLYGQLPCPEVAGSSDQEKHGTCQWPPAQVAFGPGQGANLIQPAVANARLVTVEVFSNVNLPAASPLTHLRNS